MDPPLGNNNKMHRLSGFQYIYHILVNVHNVKNDWTYVLFTDSLKVVIFKTLFFAYFIFTYEVLKFVEDGWNFNFFLNGIKYCIGLVSQQS